MRVRWIDPIAEASELPDHPGGAPLLGFFVDRRAPFFVTNPVVEDLPDKETLPMRDHSDSLLMPEAQYQGRKSLRLCLAGLRIR